jgi:prevent-host-death family protein
MTTIPAGEFKAKCLALMDEVAATGEPIHITKRGKLVARLMPPEVEEEKTATVDSIFNAFRGMVTVNGDPDELIEPAFAREEWDHLKDDWSLDPTR